MTIIERFWSLGLPADQCVVIGSGVLDALNLRRSTDIDLVVDEALFEQLRRSGEWSIENRTGGTVLLKDDVEAWLSWGSHGVPNFRDLYETSLEVDGIHFASPQFVIEQKRLRGQQKDFSDIQLLEGYLRNDTSNSRR